MATTVGRSSCCLQPLLRQLRRAQHKAAAGATTQCGDARGIACSVGPGWVAQQLGREAGASRLQQRRGGCSRISPTTQPLRAWLGGVVMVNER